MRKNPVCVCVCGWVGGVGKMGRSEVQVSRDFGRSVWRAGGTSLTLPYALRPGAWVHYTGPHAVHPGFLVLRSLMLFSRLMDGSRAISLSPDRPPAFGYFHTEMLLLFLAQAAKP